jgi:hypothetical protein
MAQTHERVMVKPGAKPVRPDLWSLRAWPALLTIVLPLAVAALYAVSVDRIVGDAGWAQLLKVSPNGKPIDLLARDVGGHMQFAVASTLLWLAAFGAVVFAGTVIVRRTTGEKIGIPLTTLVVFVVICGPVRLFEPDAISKIDPVLDNIRKALQQTGHKFLDAGATIMVNPFAALIGGGALLVCFAAVALGSAKDQTGAAGLQSRMRELERTTIFAAVFLVLLTAVNKSLADWPQAFLEESQQKAYAYLAGAISAFWGTFASLFLVLALLPAFIGVKRDIDSCAKGREASWKKDNGLEFDTKSGIGAAIAAVAPILTVPGIDLASKLLH